MTPPACAARRTARPTTAVAGALTALLAAALLAGCATPTPPTPPASAAPTTLRVIAFNDFHGQLEPGNLSLTVADPRQPGAVLRVPAGGAAALGGLVQALRAGAPHSALVATGDQVGAAPLVSSLFRHESTVEVLNRLGLDLAAAGNHEFDAGVPEMLRLHRGGCAATRPEEAGQSCVLSPVYPGARFPLLAANVQAAQGPLLPPSRVIRYGGVAVGFIGAVTRSTPGIVVPSAVAGLRFEDEAEAINRTVAALEAQGVKAIVAVVHEGGELARGNPPTDWNDRSCPGFRGPIVEITRRLSPQVDLVLSGHSHQGYNCLVDGRPVLQAFANGRGVSVADLVLDPATGDVDRARTVARNLPVLDGRTEPAVREALAAAEPPGFAQALRTAGPDAGIAELVARYAAAAAPRAQRPVGRIGGGFERAGRTDSSAGRLIADAQLAATRAPERGGARLALMNPGGIRADLPCRGSPPCTVTYGDVFSVQPFGNSLVVMTLSGAELKAVLEQQQTPGRATPSFLQPSAGLAYRWVASAPAGERVRDLTLDGRPVAADEALRVTVNSFLADGGDGFTMLTRGRDRVGGAQDIDALMAFLQTAPAPVGTARIAWAD